jgi:hypothetical protein
LILKLALNWPTMALIELIGSGIDRISLRSVLTAGLVLIFLHIFNLQFSPSRSLPVINGRKLFELSDANAKKRYRTNAKELLELGFQKVRYCSAEEKFYTKLHEDRN